MFRLALSGSGFAEIDKIAFAIRKPDQQETSAADVARRRMRHSQRKTDSDGRVHGIASVLQNSESDIGGNWLLRDDHAVPAR